MAILSDGRLLRIEVTTGWRNRATGKVYHAKKNPAQFDILAIAFHTGEIIYEPAIDDVIKREESA